MGSSTPVETSEDVIAALRLEVADLRRRMDAWERRGGPRDAEDRTLLHRIAESTRGATFIAKDLFQHAKRADPALLEALEAATVGNVGELGCWLRRHVGIHGDLHVTRKGRVWRVHMVHVEVQG